MYASWMMMGLLPWKFFQAQQQTFLLKITTHGAIQFMSIFLQGNISGIPKWGPRSRVGIYNGHSQFHAGSVAMVLNPATGHVLPKFHLLFHDEFPQLHS